MAFKIKSLLISAGILVLLFIIGFFGVNILMSIVVGTGNEVIVPDIINLPFDVARKTCMDLNLYVQQVELRHDDEIAQNRIISQSPAPNKPTKINRTVEVVVSKGPELVRVPYLDNITELEAKIRLENSGLKLGEKTFRYSNEVVRDRIIYSQPIADDFIPRGSSVDIVISLGILPDASQRRDHYRSILEGTDE
ncbi:MAG: PASTA domain-containing protein [Candidatus Cloacimonetes bacterium]|nr:PASTA domain-containing protein [Candidatus Cloacimonadota bacterium]